MDILPLQRQTHKGKVYLIGAGTGDPDLLTLKAYRLLKKADVVLYDALVSDEILSLLGKDTQCIAVGKRAGKHSAAQSEINQLLVTKAYTSKTVVRLKGGDPFIFGRGGEELEALVNANISFEVVPGITAASGAAAYAGIPLTHREHAQSVSFITGHCKLKSNPINWTLYADQSQTLVVYMGILNANIISDELIKAGRSPLTPVAIVANASNQKQTKFIGTLDKLAQLAQSPDLVMPALIIIGKVVALSSSLDWFSETQTTTASTPSINPVIQQLGE